MENKINIAEILKDCPKGMELDCTIFSDVTLYRIDTSPENEYPIRIETKNGNFLDLTKYGTYSNVEEAKCVIFPKGKTTWERFQRPFKDGDVVISDHGDIHINRDNLSSYCCKRQNYFDATITTQVKFDRLATEEEKQKLFDAIKENGYEWNPYTKTLEKLVRPKFKVGDVIQDIDGYKVRITDVSIEDGCYGYESLAVNGIGGISFNRQDEWELVPSKFDINTLKPFDKVLVRSDNSDIWQCDFFSSYNPKCSNRFHCIGIWSSICIPYIGNEHLLGTTDDCDDFYKTWE